MPGAALTRTVSVRANPPYSFEIQKGTAVGLSGSGEDSTQTRTKARNSASSASPIPDGSRRKPVPRFSRYAPRDARMDRSAGSISHETIPPAACLPQGSRKGLASATPPDAGGLSGAEHHRSHGLSVFPNRTGRTSDDRKDSGHDTAVAVDNKGEGGQSEGRAPESGTRKKPVERRRNEGRLLTGRPRKGAVARAVIKTVEEGNEDDGVSPCSSDR